MKIMVIKPANDPVNPAIKLIFVKEKIILLITKLFVAPNCINKFIVVIISYVIFILCYYMSDIKAGLNFYFSIW